MGLLLFILLIVMALTVSYWFFLGCFVLLGVIAWANSA